MPLGAIGVRIVVTPKKTTTKTRKNVFHLKCIKMNPRGKYIDGIELGVEHIGSKVTYIPKHAKGDASHPASAGGRIKSWNDRGVFVDYTTNVCHTNFSDLIWG